MPGLRTWGAKNFVDHGIFDGLMMVIMWICVTIFVDVFFFGCEWNLEVEWNFHGMLMFFFASVYMGFEWI